MLLLTRAVHGYGMEETLRLIGFDSAGRVLGSVRLPPGTAVTLPEPVWILEVPDWAGAPDGGTRARLGPILGGWPEP
jgi:hypothetical protein